MSFLFKIRKVIHTTPVLRQVSQGFANAWGAGEAYKEFDAKIGYGQSGDPVPDTTTAGASFGRDDLAEMAAERYPQVAALVQNYRGYAQGMPRRRAPEPMLDEEEEEPELLDEEEEEE